MNTILIGILVGASVFSIGFSSWALEGSGVTSDSDNINADVGIYVDGILFTIDSFSTFSLGPSGIVNDETIVDNAKIEIKFVIDNFIASNGYIVDNEFKFYAKLSCTSSDFLNTYVSKPEIYGATIENNSSTDVTYFLNSISYTISDFTENSKTSLTMIYSINDLNNSIKNFYNKNIFFNLRLEA